MQTALEVIVKKVTVLSDKHSAFRQFTELLLQSWPTGNNGNFEL